MNGEESLPAQHWRSGRDVGDPARAHLNLQAVRGQSVDAEYLASFPEEGRLVCSRV